MGKLKKIHLFLLQREIDLDQKKSLVYIAGRNCVTILDLNLDFLSSWKLPKEPPFIWSTFRGLKIDGNILYLTINGLNQICLCNSQDGKLLKEFGTIHGGSGDGQFSQPYGVTVDGQYLYICDCGNHRVQILMKENGIYYEKWGKEGSEEGQFRFPYSIYNNVLEDLIYVGDDHSVQLFKKDGVCIQRLGDKKRGSQMNQFRAVYSICVGEDDRLYVSDRSNKRIQIYKRASH